MASPPHMPTLNVPRKRPSIAGSSGANKKRKPSNLRNSFAPDVNGVSGATTPRFSRSPSAESSVAGTSMANGTTGGKGRGKRRADDSRSMTGASLRGGPGSVVGSQNAAGEGGEDEDEDDEDEGEGMDTMLEGGAQDEEDASKAEQQIRILLERLDDDQTERYTIFRRIKLRKEIVRKITNQTLSQSVPQPVIIAINGFTKVFIGELIDRALTVRDEWAAARTHLPNPNIPPSLLATAFQRPSQFKTDAVATPEDIKAAGLNIPEAPLWEEIAKDKSFSDRVKDMDKGPLTPDHLREALRRYKRDREGGGAGVAGLSLEGPERSAARMGGRPLFR
ncbi:TAFII28-domain-containing protein [Lophium mytilinum]|uniref:TAFII28-domain-containing protein n=1 Tax=Lophium mytilinum TaxID=390894 RepID=A0A6A6RHF9_9PEZI|nr:TAFII28-domain-containing protein [Lophium mytilinum]